MFAFLGMRAMVLSESSAGAYVCHRRPVGLHRDQWRLYCIRTTLVLNAMLDDTSTCVLSTCEQLGKHRSAPLILGRPHSP